VADGGSPSRVPSLYLMEEDYWGDTASDAGTEMFAGGGCSSVGSGMNGAGGGGIAGPSIGGGAGYSIEEFFVDGGVFVVVNAPVGEPLAQRLYKPDFLLSGRVDEFTVRLTPTSYLRLRFWGGTSCNYDMADAGAAAR